MSVTSQIGKKLLFIYL